jgi:nicotinamidase-related amidase
MPRRLPQKVSAAAPCGNGVALLVIDVQRGLFTKAAPIYNAEALLDRVVALVEHAHAAGSAVFYIQHTNDGWLTEGSENWQLHPRLRPVACDVVLKKHRASVLREPCLARELAARQIGTLVIAGLVSHGCVKAACQDGCSLGYRVVLAGDAHSNWGREAAKLIQAVNEEMCQAGVEIRSSEDVVFAFTNRE